jgi:stage II sporulation protein AA (anti-sigma F factor antagonist)
MDLTFEPQGAVTVVKATGDINASSCARLEEALGALIGQGRQRLVLDLGGVRYVSSAGLRVLLVVAKRLAGTGAFALSRVTEPVRQVLDMTGFSGIMKVLPSVEEAVTAVGG